MAANNQILQVRAMDSDNPPTYHEATELSVYTVPHVVNCPKNANNLKTNFCTNCDKDVAGGNFCCDCGKALVQTTQPLSISNLNNHRLPPINARQSTTVSIPSPVTIDTNHKLDMAHKVGKRLIYDFEKVSCCPWQTVGLDPKVKDQIPWELERKRITKKQWNDWMTDLMKNQKRAPSIAGCLYMFCIPGGIAQSILCALFCPISMDHCLTWLPCFYGDWYSGLRKWQDQVNSVLNLHDMHVKLITYKPWQKAPMSKLHGTRIAGKDHNYEMSMMVISLTEDETEKLKMESWDQGVHDTCTSGIGRLL